MSKFDKDMVLKNTFTESDSSPISVTGEGLSISNNDGSADLKLTIGYVKGETSDEIRISAGSALNLNLRRFSSITITTASSSYDIVVLQDRNSV